MSEHKSQQAWRYHVTGGSTSDFVLETIVIPDLNSSNNPYDILIQNHAVSLNPTDSKSRKATKTPTKTDPIIGGRDASGIVIAVKDNGLSSGFKVGDHVWYAGDTTRPGSYQQYTIVDSRIVGYKPKSLTHLQAASLPLTSLTVWEGVKEMINIEKGKRILITASAGGVGSIAIQLCKLWGLHVTATASRKETQDWVKGLGADQIIDHSKPFIDQIQQGEEFDYCLNCHDETLLPEIVSVMKPRSHITAILPILISTEQIQSAWIQLCWKRITISWEVMFSRSKLGYEQEEQRKILNEIGKLVDQGKIRHTAVKEFDWKDMVKAHDYLESGKSIGKNVIAVPI